ncbi:MAG: nucleotidyltransferase domain-containing protein [Clostridiales bacterium]|jgi:predicted nucleotidyltransferase|nr:nucleotidyltransferase domain-containing protein [Clostridiales bacterium]
MNSGFKDALSDSGMSMYSLSKQTGLPYTTINRLVNEKLSINNCNAGAVFKIASALGVQMEVLMKGECVYTLDEIAERIAPVAKKYNIPKVYIFGSYARGEANPDSDVDLMIEVGNLRGLEVIGALEEFKNALNKPVDLITTRSLTQERAQKYSKVFIDNLENDRRLIYG